MNIKWSPKTRLGKWSIILISVFAAFFIITVALVLLGKANSESNSFFDPWWSGIIVIATWVPGGAAFIIGLTGITVHKERGVWVYLATLVGCLSLVWLLVQLLGPH